MAAVISIAVFHTAAAEDVSGFSAGAAVVDVGPTKFPIVVNGNMTAKYADKIVTPVNARAIVMAQGKTQVAMVVVDSCMMPRFLLDETKSMAEMRTGIAKDHIMISATHTHTAPASMSCLGTDADPEYQAYLRIKIVEAIEAAQKRLQPAQVAFGAVDAKDFMAVRRWIRRPDKVTTDPFGNPTVRANMHAGRIWDDVTGESGPEDPDLTMVAFKGIDGKPIAMLANLSMHYFSGPPAISADYFGMFCDQIETDVAGDRGDNPRPFVAIMSHGCSGDIWRMDYTKQTPEKFEKIAIDDYTKALSELAMNTYRDLQYVDAPKLSMAETRLNLSYRVPDAQRLQWAQRIVEKMGDRLPETSEEIYAREQIYLHEMQTGEIVVQGIAIGDIAIATMPTETYALTGLKLKNQSPLKQTMVIELANGGDGYIPPPEQHVLGGYNTWAARSAGLEVNAEPKMTEAALRMLETASGKQRRLYKQSAGPVTEKILKGNPIAYWRMDEMAGPRAKDSSVHHHDGYYEPGVVFFLQGPMSDPMSDLFTIGGEVNRAAHFAGGRMRARIGAPPKTYSMAMWIWNGMPTDARPVTGWFFSRGNDFGRPAMAEQLGVGGTSGHTGKLVLQLGSDELVGGKTDIDRWTWYHVNLVRDDQSIKVFLNDAKEPEIEVAVKGDVAPWADEWFFGGSSDGTSNWEGRLDEIVISTPDGK
ncbi:MAG TPA: hypothetical protein DDZ51_24930 [Planctomycetaceae bacterium]|nr:hypothetical protein [Planctomycetaceae bacterium]